MPNWLWCFVDGVREPLCAVQNAKYWPRLTAACYKLQGSATLSMAYAGALFADACLRGLNGEVNVVECSFVESTVTDLPFFASRVKLGPNGAPSCAAFPR